jgi:hypothetical protein
MFQAPPMLEVKVNICYSNYLSTFVYLLQESAFGEFHNASLIVS